MAVLGVGGLLGLVIALVDVSSGSIVACAYLTSVIVRGGTPRTALGTAVRIQALGLRRYLEEAQSYQFSYTDALDTFRTYLPWSVVFELESQWAEVFAKLDVVAQTSELLFARDLRWFAGIGVKEPAVPPTAPVGGGATPRRGAYSEEDVVSTVLMSADQVAAEMTAAVAKVPAVRQWVPKPSSRPAVLQPQRQPPAPAVSAPSTPAAPVTPRGSGRGGHRRCGRLALRLKHSWTRRRLRHPLPHGGNLRHGGGHLSGHLVGAHQDGGNDVLLRVRAAPRRRATADGRGGRHCRLLRADVGEPAQVASEKQLGGLRHHVELREDLGPLALDLEDHGPRQVRTEGVEGVRVGELVALGLLQIATQAERLDAYGRARGCTRCATSDDDGREIGARDEHGTGADRPGRHVDERDHEAEQTTDTEHGHRDVGRLVGCGWVPAAPNQ